MSYRADIDGLRAVAVVPVVLFHAPLAMFSGGFVGVDVFFVISGFLITSLLMGDLERGQFSVIAFYERRIRRIFPALFVVLAAASVGACLWQLPDDLRRFGGSLATTSAFSSNFYFWGESGYFDAPSAGKPLLHTWSLAVEEQFYVVFPLFLAALYRLAPRVLTPVIGAALCASFALAVWGASRYPSAAFYLAPTRAWELLLGSVLALGALPQLQNRWLNELLGGLGLASIVASVLLLSPDSVFPGINALYPCLGAALVIYSGGQGRTVIAKALSVRPVVFVGLISYSLYLWHWVILVFMRYNAPRALTALEIAGAIAASAVVAVLSWRYVEMPIRSRSRRLSRRSIFVVAAVGSVGFIAFGIVLWASGGLPDRLPEQARRYAQAGKDTWPRHHDCEGRVCELNGAAPGAADVLLWGDSHAAVLAPAFEQLATLRTRKVAIAFDNACPPLLEFKDYAQPQVDCARFAEEVMQYLLASGIRRVILHARWALYTEGTRFGAEAGNNVFMTERRRAADNRAEFARQLDLTLTRLRAMNIEVDLVTSVPEVGVSVPLTLARSALRGAPAPTHSESDFLQRQANTLPVLEQTATRHGARVVHLYPQLCAQGHCALERDGWSLYSDDDHLSLHGAALVAPVLAPLLNR